MLSRAADHSRPCRHATRHRASRSRRAARFGHWHEAILALAELPNVAVKLGGLAMPFCGFDLEHGEDASSITLAEEWRPYIDTCIQAFGPGRCMIESNFPVDKLDCSYGTLWNAFKRIARSYSVEEKRALFSGTAMRLYAIPALM